MSCLVDALSMGTRCQHKHWVAGAWRPCSARAVDYGLCVQHLAAWIGQPQRDDQREPRAA